MPVKILFPALLAVLSRICFSQQSYADKSIRIIITFPPGGSLNIVGRYIVRLGIATVIAVATLAAWVHPSGAQPYPSKPIRLVVPFAAGGVTDILGRAVGQKLSQSLGQPVVVDNRAGAGGTVGSEFVSKSAPDGYTLLLGTMATHAISYSLYAKPLYDPAQDFAAICLVARTPQVLVVHPSLPVRSAKELIALGKLHPGTLNYMSPGVGTTPHLLAEVFRTAAGVDIVHVPYKGQAPGLADLIAGQVQLGFPDITSTLQYIKAGRLRALAISATERAPVLPEVSTFAEAGLPPFEGAWYAMFAPPATPRGIVSRLNAEIVKALGSSDVRASFSNQGADPIGGTPEQLSHLVRGEVAKWAKVVKASGARAE